MLSRLFDKLAAVAVLSHMVGVSVVEAESLYTLSNRSAGDGGNAILHFRVGKGGAPVFVAEYPTGQAGSGSLLDTEGPGRLTPDERCFIAVNAGRNRITAFAVMSDGSLHHRDTDRSLGVKPVSLGATNDLVVVVNEGNPQRPANVRGFFINKRCRLRSIPKLRVVLGKGVAPGEVDFAFGRILVTLKSANRLVEITLPPIADLRRLSPSVRFHSTLVGTAGKTPFAFQEIPDLGIIAVVNAEQGAFGGSTISSYRWTIRGLEFVANQVIGTTAACWVCADFPVRLLVTGDTGDNKVSARRYNGDGLVEMDFTQGATDPRPFDVVCNNATGNDVPMVFALDIDGITALKLSRSDATLTPIGHTGGVPDSAGGLVLGTR